MSQLAFDEEGEPIDLPPTATGWRVRRMKGTRGAPGLVYGSDGAPLVLPLETDIEDLRREVKIPGRYKLDAVDDRRRVLEGKAAVVVVPPDERDPNEAEVGSVSPSRVPTSEEPSTISAVMEAMRQVSEMARTIVERFPAMLEASAVLLKAADGAGLPAREPRRKQDDEGDEDDDEDDDEDGEGNEDDKPAKPKAPLGIDLNLDINSVIAKLIPDLIAAIGKGELKIPNLAEMLNWRKATPKKPAQDASSKTQAGSAAKPKAAEAADTAEGAAKSKTQTKTTPTTAEPAGSAEGAEAPGDGADAPADAATDDELPPLSLQAMAHFAAIQAALTPEEAALARAAAAELSPRDLRAWFDQLSAMTVPEAAERIRALLAASSTPEAA